MREYRKKRKTDADKKTTNEYVRRYRKTRPDELRQNYNAYMREYGVSKASKQNNNSHAKVMMKIRKSNQNH